jgi:hypothetical protein
LDCGHGEGAGISRAAEDETSAKQSFLGDRTMKDVDLERLLRAAAKVKDDEPAEPPFGFDTRLIALARRNGNGAAIVLRGLLARVALTASAIIVLAAAGAYFQFDRGNDSDVFGNEFAIADSAIQDEVGQ